MRKLLRAGFARLWKEKVFPLSCGVMLLMGAALPVIHCLDNRASGEGWTPDATCFIYASLVPILLALITALFVGCEYSDGTMRSKIIVGSRLWQIYLANLIVSAAAGFVLCAAYLAVHTGLGLLLLGGFTSAPKELLLYAGVIFALTAAFAALFTLIAMLCRNRAYSAAACILLVFALLFAGIRMTSALNEPEYYEGYSYTSGDVTVTEEAERNPHYLSGTKREIVEFLNAFIPGGQALKLANMNAEKPAMLALYDGLILLAATGCGIAVFRKKDLK